MSQETETTVSTEPQALKDSRVSELRERLESQATSARPHEYVRALVDLADALPAGTEKVELYLKAADLYANKFMNQAEALRTFEKIREVDPRNAQAVEFLEQMYEKRRDWDRLIALKRDLADGLENPLERGVAYKAIAELANDRVKKPETCIELWTIVRSHDPEDYDALRALALLYERTRAYEELAGALEALWPIAPPDDQVGFLTKLGQVVGDRLKDEARAVDAYRNLLTLSTDLTTRRRAEEQLKKRYATLGRWDDLEQLYAEGGKWDEFIRILESNEARTQDEDQRIAMLMKIAELWMTQKGKPDRAARAYERILGLRDDHLEAAERLILLYENLSNPKGMSVALEVKLKHMHEPAERVELLRQVAQLHEIRSSDRVLSFQRYQEVFELLPTDERAQQDAERAAERAGAWDALIVSYRKAVGDADEAGDIAAVVGLRLKLGRLLLDRLDQVDQALTEYREVLGLQADNVEALTALERLYEKAGQFEELLAVYNKRRALAVDPTTRTDVLYRIAQLSDEHLGDWNAAIDAYTEILDEMPGDQRALEALDRLYQRVKDWPRYADVLKRRLDSDPSSSAVLDLKFRLANVQTAYLAEPDAALEHYREILLYDPTHEGARHALEVLLEQPSQRAEAASILESVYEAVSDYESLLQVSEMLVEVAETTERKVEVLRRMAVVAATQLGDRKRAFQAQVRAVEADPKNDTARDELEEFAEQADGWSEVTQLYMKVARAARDQHISRDYWLRTAALQQRLGRSAEAAQSYAQLLKLDPNDARALEALEALHRAEGDWTSLIKVYRRRIDLALDATERQQILTRMAGVYEQEIGDLDEAINAYREILELDGADRAALGALEGLLGRRERWSELAEHLELRLTQATSESEELELMLRAAALREQQMDDTEGAVEGYRQVLERDPNSKSAVTALERMAQRSSQKLLIAEILEPLYRAQAQYDKLVSVHEVQIDHASDPHHKVDLLHRLAELQEDSMGDPNAAFDTYTRALEVDAASETTGSSLERLVRVNRRYADLAKTYERLAATQQDPELAAMLYMRAGRVLQNDLNELDAAAQLYGRALEASPTQLEGIAALQLLLQSSERYAELSELLQRKATILDDVEEKKRALFEAANLEEMVLERPERAVHVYESVLEVEPEDLRSLDALANLFLRAENWTKLLEVHARKAELVIEPQERKSLFYQMGSVYQRELGDVERAIEAYQHALDLDPDDMTALSRLDSLYQEAGNWSELLGVIARQVELTDDPTQANEMQFRIAELHHRRLDDLARAIELYAEVLRARPDHEGALAALEQLKDGSKEALAAATVLEGVYDAMGDYPKLIGALSVQARVAEDPFAKVELLHRIARLHEDGVGDLQQAFDAYAAAVRVDCENEESLGAFERLAMALDAWARVAQLYDQQLETLRGEPDRACEFGLRVAQVYEVQLESPDEAIARYRDVLDAAPDNIVALRALDRLYQQTSRWQELAEVVSQEAEVADTPEAILEFKYRLGRVYQDHLGDTAAAVASYREVIEGAPGHEATLVALEDLFHSGVRQLEIGEILESLYQSTGDSEKLVAVYQAELPHLDDLEQRMAMYYRIAEIQEERHGDVGQAFATYAQALSEAPLDERTEQEMERLAALLDSGWEMVAHRYADVVADEARSADVRVLMARRLAKVFEEQLGDTPRAEESYLCALQLADNDLDALLNLDRIYTEQGSWDKLSQILAQRSLAVTDADERVELLLRLATTYEDNLGEPARAVGPLRKIFDELDPQNEQAVQGLARIYEVTGDWHKLKAVYERQLDAALGDAEQADIHAKMARLASSHLNELQEAVDRWKQVLDLRGEDMEALDALAEIYERQERWPELSEVLERQFDVVESDEERVMALTRRARLFSKALGRDDDALEVWHRVLDIDFANPAALRAVADLWRKRENPSELVHALHTLVDRASDVLDKAELCKVYRELGQLYTEVLVQPPEAAEAWNALLQVYPTDLEAMSELEKNYRADDRLVDVVGVKMMRAAALEDPEAKIAELSEVVEMWKTQIGDFDRAVPALEQVLAADPGNESAFRQLERLHQSAERWEPLVELYLNRLDSVESTQARSELLRKIAGVFEERLGDSNQAFDALMTAFEGDYSDDLTTEQIARVAGACARWPELIQAANEWLQAEQDVGRQIQLCLRLGKWYGEDLNRQDYAQHYYAKVSQLDPNNAQVLRQMARIYRLRGEYAPAGQTLQRALDVAIATEDRRAVLTDMGELLEKHMDRVEQAIAHYRRALETDAHYGPAVEALERLYTSRGEHAELAQVLENKVEVLSEDREIAATEQRLGEIYEQELKDFEAAARAYKKTVEIDGSNVHALRGLERVYRHLEKWGELAQVLERQLLVLETERERVEVLLKIANIHEEQFLKPEEAVARYQQAVGINPSEIKAYEGMERCFRRLKRWHDLVETYEAHMLEVDQDAKKLELLTEIASVYVDEIGDVNQAVSAYQNIVDIDERNLEALTALARLFEKQEDASRAIEAMSRVAELTHDVPQRVSMYFRMGQTFEHQLSDRAEARNNFETALELDQNHLASISALRHIAVDEGDWEACAKYLEQEVRCTEGARAKADLLVLLGQIRSERLEDGSAAAAAWEAALQLDPECEQAAEPLVAQYVEQKRWDVAEPLAELIVKKGKNRERREQHQLNNLLGRISSALGNYDKAVKAYAAANKLDMTDQESIRGLADASYQLKDWPSALSNYQKVLTALSEDEADERIRVYYRLGCIKREQGQTKQAINNYEKALALGEHRPTLEALVDVYAKAGDWREVAAYKRQILDGVFDEAERFDLLVQLGEVWAVKVGDPAKAIDAYQEARELQPVNHVILHRLLELYQGTHDWPNMVEMIGAVSELESDVKKKARYFYTMAQLYRDKIGDLGRAVELFNEALDHDPRLLEAFERINRILTKEANWKQLERNYRKMLHRLSGTPERNLEFNLWHQLGLIYRDRIKEPESALAAFKKASQLQPEDNQERTILAELYEVGGHFDDALRETRVLLAQDPLSAELYNSLYRLSLHKRSYDEAWCAAAVLVFLKKADPEQQEFFESYRSQGMLAVKGQLSNDMWLKNVFHKEEDLYISKIFEMISEAALRAKVSQLRVQRALPPLDVRWKQDLASSTVTFAKTFDWTSRVLGVQPPELYIRSDADGGVRAVPAEPRASIAGKGVLSGFQPKELAFLCGRHLAGYRGEHSIRTLFPTQSELTIMFFAAVLLAAPGTPMPQELVPSIRAATGELKRHIQAVHYEALGKVVKAFIGEGARANIKRWNHAVDMTSSRAGLVVSGDLEVAKKILSQEQVMPGEVPAKDKMKDLLTYFVSQEYSLVRQALGIEVKV